MQLLSRTCVALSVLSLFVSGEEDGRILRMRGRGRDRKNKQDEGVCELGSPELFFTMVGEFTSPEGAFLVPQPEMPIHREVLGWGDEEIADHWAAASEFFKEFAGVDFTDMPVDETGIKQMDGWAIMPLTVYFGLRVPYTSVHGVFDCPVEVLDEGLGLVPNKEGMVYHGTYGGEAGIPAKLGDLSPFGHYIMDFDGKPETPPSVWHYEAAAPFSEEPDDHTYFINCNLFNDRWGSGKNEGRFDFLTPSSEGHPHVSSRSIVSFPARFDL